MRTATSGLRAWGVMEKSKTNPSAMHRRTFLGTYTALCFTPLPLKDFYLNRGEESKALEQEHSGDACSGANWATLIHRTLSLRGEKVSSDNNKLLLKLPKLPKQSKQRNKQVVLAAIGALPHVKSANFNNNVKLNVGSNRTSDSPEMPFALQVGLLQSRSLILKGLSISLYWSRFRPGLRMDIEGSIYFSILYWWCLI